ncbi:MAG: hypothetical protein KF778_22280 [Rhodocyclaceae bacterium]|nr:hypothetical protein [Rhodocyclaceae bacterium]MBX3671134.1 hypothetical protein [Rhodocyclaceae bacterium]
MTRPGRAARRLGRGILFVALVLTTCSSALACSPVADRRPYAERLASVPLAFIGTVLAAGADRVEFKVEHLLQGELAQATYALPRTPSTCNLEFLAGQRWLYAGDAITHPSLLLSGPGLAGRKPVQPQRVEDAALDLPAAWQRCERDPQCRRVRGPCGPASAVRAERQPEAEARLARASHDGHACPTQARVTYAACVALRCGLWTLALP